ncbi:hypothetical protein cyc_06112 [Cyclospora cayetanensis]|uniref:NOL1/NOP2/Sun domain family member 4 n=1 Tax=Cyclospora cayetanensis TaxID=88456 RepID=A0A1D3D459_9EIME|nr:hypothetical protein cyc_06112 [Cyclospora cayetanensis]
MSVRGGASWSATYCKQYGRDRWNVLLNALADVPTQIAFVAPTISHSALRYLQRKSRFLPCVIPNCFIHDSNAELRMDNESSAPSSSALPTSTELVESNTVGASDAGRSTVHAVATNFPCNNCGHPGASGQGPANRDLNKQVQIVDDDHVIEEAREKTYFLDGASALAAYALGAQPGEVVLDMCAAPGGKSLIISCMITVARVPYYAIGSPSMPYHIRSSEDDEDDQGGLLVCNDASRDRLARLQATMSKFLPEYATAGQRLQFSCADVCKGGSFERFAPYDRILLDAPCSSDRHLLHKGGSAIANWSPSTPKAHAERQLKMLLIASKLLKRNGILLYTTCSLSEAENDAVGSAQRNDFVLDSGKYRSFVPFRRDLSAFSGCWGNPCRTLDMSNFGPMYFCKMQITGQ